LTPPRLANYDRKIGRLHGRADRGRLAQLVERHAYTVNVGGSSPSSPTYCKSWPVISF
jgi:hypothetical protein